MLELWRAALNAFGVQPEGRRIKQLWVFPVRGCKGASVAVADILPGAGFAVDGMWCIVDRADPTRIVEDELTHAISVSVSTTTDGKHKILCLRAQGMPPLSLRLDGEGGVTEQLQLTEGLSNRGLADSGRRHPQGSQWISEYMGRPCALIRLSRAITSPTAHPVLRARTRLSAGDSSPDSFRSGSGSVGSAMEGRRAPGLMRASGATRVRSLSDPTAPPSPPSPPALSSPLAASAPSFAVAPSAEDGRLVRRGSVGADGKLLYRHDHLQVRLFNPSSSLSLSQQFHDVPTANIVVSAPAGEEDTWRQVMITQPGGTRGGSGAVGGGGSSSGRVVTMQRSPVSRSSGMPKPLCAFTMAPTQYGQLHVGDEISVVRYASTSRPLMVPGAPGSPKGARAGAATRAADEDDLLQTLKHLFLFTLFIGVSLGAASWTAGGSLDEAP